jgi:hypothetical protein
MKNKVWLKSFLIGLSALVITTLGIQASDEFGGISSSLSGGAINSENVCDTDSVLVVVDSHTVCIDRYEASPSSDCLYTNPQSEQETIVNLAQSDCKAESKEKVLPWRFISHTQAQQMCARSGKRLLNNLEWYKNALSISNINSCFDNNMLQITGYSNCKSENDISDLIGNVWEWTEEIVVDGKWGDRILPDSGYVKLVDNSGIVIETSSDPDKAFSSDYAWMEKEGVTGILRGGFYGTGIEDGGLFSQNLNIPLNFAGAGVGFRCVRDVI